MVIQNEVGGWCNILELGVKLGPGQIVDLDFYCTREVQRTSKELKRAISRRFVKVIDAEAIPQGTHLHESSTDPGEVIAANQPSGAAVRRALFIRTDIPENPPYKAYALRDTPSKLAIIKLATDTGLLDTIVRKEQHVRAVRAAYDRLQELVKLPAEKGE